ncbi:MAG: hypothetical protein HOD63_12130 [Bacteroidetes bacterium]|nr:hypothetical protein [Bacteroidota bacterium]MBT4729253.1 hypothetical protein [Bacteroidota bacterium]MBT4970891.1 hypothetical protein [Bacteroidota bacterium]
MQKTKLVILFSFLILSVSCNKKETVEKKVDEAVVSVKSDALIIGDPFKYGIENLVLFPVGSNYKPKVYEKRFLKSSSAKQSAIDISFSFKMNTVGYFYDTNASTEYINVDEDQFDIRNILFYNLKTGVSYPLIHDSLHILSFALHKDYDNPLIFYRVVKNDNNKDSIFNKNDAVMLYVSDLYGKNFTQITPEDEHYVNYTLYSERKTILIKTIIDSDNDSSFTVVDETNFREMSLDKPAMGRSIFSNTLKDSLRSLL